MSECSNERSECAGKPTVIVTREKVQGETFAQSLRKEGISVCLAPVFNVCSELSESGIPCDENAWYLFTSANAVRMAGPALPANARIAVIGRATEHAVKDLGYDVSVTATEETGCGLAEAFACYCGETQDSIYILDGSHARGDLLRALQSHGYKPTRIVVYCIERREWDQEEKEQILQTLGSQTSPIITAFSARSVEFLSENFRSIDFPINLPTSYLQLPLVVLGQKALKTAQALGFTQVTVAATHDEASVIQEIFRICDRDKASVKTT